MTVPPKIHSFAACQGITKFNCLWIECVHLSKEGALLQAVPKEMTEEGHGKVETHVFVIEGADK